MCSIEDTPWNHSDHHSTVVLRGLRGTTIGPPLCRDTLASRTAGEFFPIFPSDYKSCSHNDRDCRIFFQFKMINENILVWETRKIESYINIFSFIEYFDWVFIIFFIQYFYYALTFSYLEIKYLWIQMPQLRCEGLYRNDRNEIKKYDHYDRN